MFRRIDGWNWENVGGVLWKFRCGGALVGQRKVGERVDEWNGCGGRFWGKGGRKGGKVGENGE